MPRHFSGFLLCTACLLLLTARSASSQPIPMTFDELVSEANVVVRGYVADQQAEWIDSDQGRAIVTVVTFRVERTLKGTNRVQIPLEFLGGTIGDVGLRPSHVPTFEVGDRAVLFLDTTERLISPVVGSELGLFRIVVSPDGSGDAVVSHNGVTFSSVVQLGVPSADGAPAAPMSLGRFEAEIVQAVQEIR
ncbi:MAG: hypothetical protein QF681_11185 [Vicinamibacterales bacterium]|jgi:hypothetical protein|nr:hypothetical protein [Vicinamibacterales bacterium]